MAPHWQDPPLADDDEWDDDQLSAEAQRLFEEWLDRRPAHYWRPWQDVRPREEYL